MQKKIMQVFYGNDGLPYKDQARTVHYPIVGTGFTGASDTTEIRFYVDRIGGIYTPTWIANTKLPNGKKGYKLLTTGRDALLGENYVSLSLTSFYTQVKGDVYISLNGYNGGVQLEQDEEENYVLIGTPTIEATGSIKITMQYAVQILPSDIQEYIDLDDLLAYISGLATDENVNANFLKRLKLKPTDTDYTTTPLYQLLENEELLTDFTTGKYTIFELEIDMGTNADLYLVSARLTDDEYGSTIHLFEYGDGARIRYGEANTVITNAISIILAQAGYAELATLTDLAQYYKSTQVDTLLAGKVDKTSIAYKLYGTSFTGSQSAITYGTSATQNTIVQRWVDGNVIVPLEPDGNNCATSKKYVDDLISTIKADNIIIVSTIVYPTLEDFLTTTGEEGDIYLYPIDTTDLTKGYYRYIWEGNEWLSMGTTEIDLSDYYTKSETNTLLSGKQNTLTFDNAPTQSSDNPVKSGGIYTALSGKQDTLVSGTNIKTINNQSILGSGNIDIQGGGGGATWGSITGTLSDQTDLNNALTDIREVAEGKCKTIVISYLTTAPTQATFVANKYKLLDGTPLDTWNDFVDNVLDYTHSGYDLPFDNASFNSSNLYIGSQGGYVITTDNYVVRLAFYPNGPDTDAVSDLKVGDIIIITETDVPDRWISIESGGYYAYCLETTKVDLSVYYTKTESDNRYAKLEQGLNVINASDITNSQLTQAQYDLITNGKPTLIKGTVNGKKDPLLLDFSSTNGLGVCLCKVYDNTDYNHYVCSFSINSSKVIIFNISNQYLVWTRVGNFQINSQNATLGQLNQRAINYYLNNVYPYATNSTTTLQYETINNISISADTTFTLATAPSNTYPEYKANITNSSANSITITLPSGTSIKGNVSISSNTFEIPANSSVELNIQNGRAIVVEW